MQSLGEKRELDIGVGAVPPLRDEKSNSDLMMLEIEVCNGGCTGMNQQLKLRTDGGAKVVPALRNPGHTAITVGNVSALIPNDIAVQLRDGLNSLNL